MSELQRAHARAEQQSQRVAELEDRLAQLEQSQKSAPPAAATTSDPAVLARLDALLMLNQELLSRAPASGASESSPAPGQTSTSDVNVADCGSDDPREQLRALVSRIHGTKSGFRGGLSPSQSAALRVLLQRERSLDAANPWQQGW